MGLLLCKGCCCWRIENSRVDVLSDKDFKLLLLGLAESGKTEVAHMLSNRKRLDYDPTNGVQYYQMQSSIEGFDGKLSITEVGGSAEIQKIWHHYYVMAMGIIYCFDMSASYDKLRQSFDVFQRTMMHPYVRGKPVLLVATKADLVDEGLQLYDIENNFHLDAMARRYASSIHLCYFNGGMENWSATNSLNDGITWLQKYLLDNYNLLKMRIKYDTNMKMWQQETQKLIAAGRIRRSPYHRFPYRPRGFDRRKHFWRLLTARSRHRSNRIRPYTAPSVIYTISRSTDYSTSTCKSTSSEVPAQSNAVPNVMKADIVPNGKVTEV